MCEKAEPLEIKVRYFDPNLPRIEKINVGDWIDLRAAEDVVMGKDDFAIIPLGVAMELPEGHEGHIAPRSGTFKNWGILMTNSPGVIDEAYCGNNDQWCFSAYACRNTTIRKGDRICHFRIVKKMPAVRFVEVETLDNPDRGAFGSTGAR